MSADYAERTVREQRIAEGLCPDCGNIPDDCECRRLVLTPASSIRLRRTAYLWRDRLPLGTLTLLAGREGLGKSLTWCHVAARITRGTLPGEHYGEPRSVLVVGTEDSWSHTIAPRLLAAGADMTRVYRVDAITSGAVDALVLPLDVARLEQSIRDTEAVLLIADPLVSALDARLDTHRDREVRHALEPLSALADRTRCSVLGLVHYGKRGGTDPGDLVLGSRGFTATARCVLGVVQDPDADDGSCLLAVTKNNLGRLDLPALRYSVESVTVATEDGPAEVGRLVWLGEVDGRGVDHLRDALAGAGEDRGERDEVAAHIADALDAGPARARDVLASVAEATGASARTIRRAADRLGVEKHKRGAPGERGWWEWSLSRRGHEDAEEDRAQTPDPFGGPVSPSGVCAECGDPMIAVEPGQRAHPTCNPTEDAA